MANFLLDKKNSFGVVTAAGDFPDTLALGEASLERMTVELKTPDGPLADTDSVTLTVKGSDTEAGTYTAIVTGEAVTGKRLREEGYGLPVPKNPYRFIRAAVAGSWTGTVAALVNSYIGK